MTLFSALSTGRRSGWSNRCVLPAILLPLLLAALTACESKSQSRLEAQRAFVAGQQQALVQSGAKPRIVTVKGRVRNSIVPWTDGMTLRSAIIAADYTGYMDPVLIRVVRDGQNTDFKPSDLLQGQDMPLEAGDLVQLIQ